jgi:hypothetical protein
MGSETSLVGPGASYLQSGPSFTQGRFPSENGPIFSAVASPIPPKAASESRRASSAESSSGAMHYCPRCPREGAGRAVCMSPRLAASAQRTAVGYWLPMPVRLACTMPRRRRADASSTVTPGPGRRRSDSVGVERTGQVDQSRTFVREAARRRRQCHSRTARSRKGAIGDLFSSSTTGATWRACKAR